MERTPLSLKIGDHVYFKNKQPSKWDLKWRPDIELSALSMMDTLTLPSSSISLMFHMYSNRFVMLL